VFVIGDAWRTLGRNHAQHTVQAKLAPIENRQSEGSEAPERASHHCAILDVFASVVMSKSAYYSSNVSIKKVERIPVDGCEHELEDVFLVDTIFHKFRI
jgi:hypothetical protein